MMFHEIDGKISIHAPREGGDSMGKAIKIVNTDFNPRPPRGGRHSIWLHCLLLLVFQSTPPARGATLLLCPLFS